MVDVSGVCTGSILGKRHILSAAHCFAAVQNYNNYKFFYVGTHHKLDRSTGQRLQRNSIVGVTKNGYPVEFPLHYFYQFDRNLIDIAIIILDSEICFTENIKKVRLENPKDASDNCLECSGDCDPSKIFKVYGWGNHELGIRHFFILTNLY